MLQARVLKAGTTGLLAIALGALSLSAAATIQYTTWQSATTGQQATTGAITALAFDQYDAAAHGGAALHNVEFILGGTGYGVYEFVDASGASNTFTFIANITVSVANPGGGNFIIAIPSVQDIQRTVGALATYTSPGFGPPADFTQGLTNTASQTATYVGPSLTPAIAALFSGAGTVSLDTSAAIVNATLSNGDNDTSIRSRYDATLQVRYSYDVPEVPEPATLLLLGAGAAGLGLRRRRTQAAA